MTPVGTPPLEVEPLGDFVLRPLVLSHISFQIMPPSRSAMSERNGATAPDKLNFAPVDERQSGADVGEACCFLLHT